MDYRFNHVHLVCSNLQHSIDFFYKVLGATLVGRKKFGNADGALLKLDQTNINLRVRADGETIDEKRSCSVFGYHHICVAVDDIDAAYEDLCEKKIEFISPPKLTPDKDRIAFFKGPDDIVIELLQLS